MAESLTREEIAECRESFKVFDQNGDGKITSKELHNVLMSLGQRRTQKECDEMVQVYDVDNSGTIEFTEFLHMVVRVRFCKK